MHDKIEDNIICKTRFFWKENSDKMIGLQIQLEYNWVWHCCHSGHPCSWGSNWKVSTIGLWIFSSALLGWNQVSSWLAAGHITSLPLSPPGLPRCRHNLKLKNQFFISTNLGSSVGSLWWPGLICWFSMVTWRQDGDHHWEWSAVSRTNDPRPS